MSNSVPYPIETRILRQPTRTISVELPGVDVQVSDVIRAKVFAEWNNDPALAARESLPPEALSRRTPSRFDSAQAAYRASIDGYRSGWYIITVNGEEPSGLDARVPLTPETAFAFIRIYPLPEASE